MEMKQQPVIIYDINSLPDPEIGLTFEDIVKFFRKEGVLLYVGETPEGIRTQKPIIMDAMDFEVVCTDLSLQENMKKLNGYRKKLK